MYFAVWILYKAEDLNQLPVYEVDVCSDSSRTEQPP